MAFAKEHIGAGNMTRLRRPRRMLVLVLLLYAVTANAGISVGWMCCVGPHFGRGGDSAGLPGLSSRPQHEERTAFLPDTVTLASHCCACSASPLVNRAIAEHVGSYIDLSDPTSLSAHGSSFIEELGASFTRRGHLFDPSDWGGNPDLACLSTVVLLI